MTLMDNPRALDPKCPGPQASVPAFAALAEALPGRVAWRYDPLVFTEKTPPDWHRATFERLCARLSGRTDRVIVSFMEPYRKIAGRMRHMAEAGFPLLPVEQTEAVSLLMDLRDMAAAQGMRLFTCCQPEVFELAGIAASRCIDPDWIAARTGKPLPPGKDAHQRPRCGCARARTSARTTAACSAAATATPRRASSAPRRSTGVMIPTRRRCEGWKPAGGRLRNWRVVR
jgi:hypothetical protein